MLRKISLLTKSVYDYEQILKAYKRLVFNNFREYPINPTIRDWASEIDFDKGVF